MNIHFKDKKLFKDLTYNTVARVRVGSHLYSLNNENSDEDYLNIYLEDNRNSFLWEHHQLQFKENGVDHNFTTLQGFIRNILTGDSTINYEVLYTDRLKKSDLNWLWERRSYFDNYNIIKAYLGLARRDHQFWLRESFKGVKQNIHTNKRAMHLVRGVISMTNIIDGCFSNNFQKTNTFKLGSDDHTLLLKLKNGEFNQKTLLDIVETSWQLILTARKKLNDRLDKKELSTFMDVDHLKEIDVELLEFITNYSKEVRVLDYGNLFYDALEKNVQYGKSF